MSKQRANLKVLIVEDEFLISALLEDFCRDWGCGEIVSRAESKDALASIEERCPDLALLDVKLRNTTSFEIAAVLKGKKVPFLFVTAFGDDGMPKEWRDHPRLDKPFSFEELETALRAMVSQ